MGKAERNEQRVLNSVRNMATSAVLQTVLGILAFVERTFFIRCLSIEYLGLNSLFSNILNVLSMAELGISSAIAFALYKPIAENNFALIKSYMAFFKKAYRVIGSVILIIGILLSPFINLFIEDEQNIENASYYFLIYLFGVGLTYFYSYKQILIEADQKKYINQLVICFGSILRVVVQLIAISITRDYGVYIFLYLVFNVGKNIVLAIWADRLYPYLKERNVAKLESKISLIRKKKSVLMVNIYKIIKYLLIFLFPATLIVALKTYYVGVDGVHWVFSLDIITKSASTLVGMIPIGMILLSSITLSEAIVKLFKKKTMVQELYAIENLSRVTTLCLDKTGTLTTQKFVVENVVSYDDSINLNNIMKIYLGVEKNGNATSLSLKKYFGEITNIKFIKYDPFDSSKKCSKLILKENETYSLGAPDFILDKESKIFNDALNYSKDGYRVLAFTKNNVGIALFLLKDELRKGIKDTLSYFDNLNVTIKIISGDNVSTVQEVCKLAGVKNYEKAISLEGYKIDQIKEIASEYTIFARTSPDQKQEIIKSLEESENVVGYIGDGVNDTLSLRQADCSIALKSGADSTKAVSDVVLLDDDFSHLPDVLKEGRRVVSNIKRSLLLFLTKAIFIGIFSIFSVFLINGLPIEIESIYIYEFISVALCGFLLSIENNKVEADKSDFVTSVLTKAFVFGIFMFISACIPLLMDVFYEINYLSALITINITISGLVILLVICRPFNKYTLIVYIVGVILSLLALLAFPNVFLDSTYLKGANNFAEQLKLIQNAFFNFKYFYGMSYKEYLIPIIYIFISYPLYLLINLGLNKLVPFIVKVKEKIVTKLHK